jgi:hypothetical protein
VLDRDRPEVQLRGRSVPLSLLAIALVVAVPIVWFVHLANEHTPLKCTTPSDGVTHIIDSTMRDPRTHVEHLEGVQVPLGDTGASFDSGNVYVDDVSVGVGTWWANFFDMPGGKLGQYGVLQPVNDLAQAVSVDQFSHPPPKENKAARFSQHCVPGS